MFPTMIDAVLHLVVFILSYLFFGEFAAKAYIGFAVLNIIILWLMYGDFVECLKEVPIWFWNLTTNLLLLLAITPALIGVAKTKKEALSVRLETAKDLLSQPPNFYGKYMLEKVCEIPCNKEILTKEIVKIEKTLEVYEAYLRSLWWDTLPFAWGFFLLSLAASFYITLKKKH